MIAWGKCIPPSVVHTTYSSRKYDVEPKLVVNSTDPFIYYSSLFSIHFIILFATKILPALHSKQQIMPLNSN